MLKEITSKQWAEWIMFYGQEPWGEEYRRELDEYRREYDQHLLAALFAHLANCSPKFKKANWSARDFLPRKEEEPKTLADKAKAVFQSLGVVEVKRGESR